MNRGWLALVAVGSMLALCLAQTNIQPIELIIMVDDSPGVGANNWRITMDFMKNVVKGTKQLLDANTWKLGIVTFSGREIVRLQSGSSTTIDNLIDQASYQASNSQAGWNVVSTMLRNEGRQGIASVVVIMPSSSLQYSQGDVSLWADSLTTEFHSFRLIVGLGLDASSASFFRSQSTTDQIDGTSSFLETSYNQLTVDATQNNIIERLYKAATHATPPEGPEDCLDMDLVFVIDERTAPFINEVREFIKNTLRLITNTLLSQVAVGFVSVGSQGNLIKRFREVDYSEMNAEVDRLSYQQSNIADLGQAIPVIRSMLDGTIFDRSLEPNVIVFITYREPDIRSLQQNLIAYDLAFASIIAVGVETTATTLNSIATVTAWRSLVPSMSKLPEYGGNVREKICAAAIPVCFYAADVALVVDAGSFQAVSNWESIKNLVKDIVQSYFYGYNGVRFAIVLYGDNAQVEYNLQDSMGNRYPKLAQFAEQIEGLRSLSVSFSPNPAAAFRMVREQVFSPNIGDRDANRNVVVWIPASVTSQMDASLQSEVAEMKRAKLAVGVIGLALSQEGVDIANNFASRVAADDMTYFVSDYNTLQVEESRVRIIFDYISPIICRVYKTNFIGGPPVKGVKGQPGIVGPNGPPGLQGQNGEPGRRGPNGDIGNPGGPGIPGPVGDPGNLGARGPNGDPGLPGSPGQQGDVGLQGNPGIPGSNGPKGQQGERGASAPGQGAKGDPGFGSPGLPGSRGDNGDQGIKGSAAGRGQKGQRGPDGQKGNAGRLGIPGNPGLNGSPGSDGNRGQIGDKGNAGLPGVGAAGPKGIRGDNGGPGSPGIFGTPGNKGTKGEPGPNGTPGFPGQKGDNGNAGRNGSPGANGSFGQKGEPGGGGIANKGRQGVKGESGAQGFQGPNGLPGNNGQAGEKGDRGIPGDAGISGGNGNNGIKGERGDAGTPGAPGNPGLPGQGFQGEKGNRGDNGQPGQPGQRGLNGIQGIKGVKGGKGDNGFQGNFGRQGGRGANGFKGQPGAKGNQGANGQSFVGQKGERGFEGNPGTPGSDGRPGTPGIPGIPGDKGNKGNFGNPGNPGANGNQGQQGSAGLTGERGSPGVRGDAGGGFPGRPGVDGNPGLNGQRGIDGVPGGNGVKGERGDQGLSAGPGLTGDVGEKGDRGSPGFGGVPGNEGETGFTGFTGFTGDRGINGSPGNRGREGPKGVSGRVGPQGPQGPKGLSGNSVRGPDGQPGPQGREGPPGLPGTGGVSYVDECQSFNPCTQKCVDTYDSYYCACDEGYELTGGQIDCPRPAGKRKKRQAPSNCQTNFLDMVLLIDTSAWNFDYNQVVQTIEKFLNAAGFCNRQSNMRVAVVTFGAQPNMIHSFNDGQTFSAVKTKLDQNSPSTAYDNNPLAAFQQLATWTSPGGQLAPRSNAQLIIGFFTTYGFYALQDDTIAAANVLKTRSTNPATIFAYGVKYAIERDLREVASNGYFAKAAEYNQFADAVSSAVVGNPVFQGDIVDPTTPPPGTGGDCFGADLDVAILVDVSWWVGSFSDFTSQVSQFVSSFPSCNSETVRFAVVSYTQNDARLERQLTRNVDQVQSTLQGLEFRGEWDINLQPALIVADTQVFSQSTSANKLILVLSARNQDGINMADLKRKYTIAAYGFKRGAEDQGWLSNVPSDNRLSFTSPDPNTMSLARDLSPMVDRLREVLDIEIPDPIGPDPLDLVLILDASGSIEVNFNAMKQFLKDVIQNLNVGSNNVRIGLVRFSQTASVPFGLTRYNSLQDVVSAIDQVQRIGGRTNIAASLRTTDNLFETQGRSNVPHVALIITDGYANEEIARTVYDASILRSKGVHVLGVQVNDPRMLMNQMVPLESIATSFEYVYKYGSHRELREVVQRINVQKGIKQLGYVDYDIAPQPETYYCRDTTHGNMCFCRETPFRPINGSQCIDIDECQHNNGGCEQRCQNNRGSFTCACDSGYRLSDDMRTCLDVDECEGSQVCTPNTMCINHAGGFICVEPSNTDPQTGAMVGSLVAPTVSAGIIVAISLGAAVGTVALAVALALVGRNIVRRGEEEQEEHVESLPTPSASSSTYGTVRSKLSMAHSENKAAL